jgi:hypothetical protein
MEAVDQAPLVYEAANGITPLDITATPYTEGVFRGFRILFVNLYAGSETLSNTWGRCMEQQGFRYTIVCSYGDAIEELCRQEQGRCPYTQLWLISSAGQSLPREARDRDTTKLSPFLEAVTDFWQGGGGLMLFFDNDPYTLEGNLLLKDYLTFAVNNEEPHRATRVRFGGCWMGNTAIAVAATDVPTRQGFSPQVQLPAPGRCGMRLSLRPGLVTFHEGYTISSAVDEQKRPLSTDNELWPFKSFAWTSEPVTPPHPFVLYYDPTITSETLECPGPIVLHGAFTSAFSGFTTDGTGRLFGSIASWLTRLEERRYRALLTGEPVLKSTPPLARARIARAQAGDWERDRAPPNQ